MRRALVAPLALLLVLTGGTVTGPAPAAATPAGKLEPAAATALAGGQRTDLLVALTERADLSGARARRTHAERTGYGRKKLVEVAERSQRGVRALLARQGFRHRSLWIVNAVHVTGADAGLAAELAKRRDVRSVSTVKTIALPKPRPAAVAAVADGVEWNVRGIGAESVWARYGTRGEGIVVANIDSGVQYDHPALVEQYRGNHGDGVFDHSYNWYDPFGQCTVETGPCDVNGHGTHTMGTMVGDDGTNHVGVAPGARWIAARGCQGVGCNVIALLMAAQWLVAPFDGNLANPRPDLAPHIINNSWGSATSDPFFQDAVRRWVEVGIMPIFAAGNDGPGCGGIGSPADYADGYTIAAHDSAGAIAGFSSRGAAGDAQIKPDIAAPGVAIRSTLPDSRYEAWDGTSMAAPHAAGAVALLWSAAPSLIGDVAATRALLDDAATDVPDTSCGGTADDNRVAGEGRLNILAAVGRAPLGPFGTITGLARSGAGVAGVRIRVVGGDRVERVTTTDAAGRYTAQVPAGSYRVTATAFGYSPATVGPAAVTAGTTTTANLDLAKLARHRVSGVVRDSGGVPAGGITVWLPRTPLAAVTTGADGAYRFDEVPIGGYTLSFGAGRCLAAGTKQVTVDGDEIVDVYPHVRVDTYGYHCHQAVTPYVAGTSVLPLTGDDESLEVALPFAMPFYGATYTRAWIATNGFLTFDRAADNSVNREVPNSSYPNAAIFALWDDLVVDAAASVRTATLGTAPDRRFVVEWRNVGFYGTPDRATFSAELSEHGGVTVHYGQMIGGTVSRGGSASVGIENIGGTSGLEYARDAAVLTPGSAVAFRASATLRGTVTRTDGTPAGGATVRAARGDAPAVTTTTAADGTYLLHLPLGTYIVDVRLAMFGLHRATVVLDADGATVQHHVRLQANERTVSGVVRDDLGAPIEGAKVRLLLMGTSVDVTFARTGEDGVYRFERVPETDQTAVLYAEVPKCLRDGREYLDEILGGDVTRDITVVAPSGVVDGADGYGYQCRVGVARPATASTPVTIGANDTPPTPVPLPFAFPFYGHAYGTAHVAAHGYLTFEPQSRQSGSNEALPANTAPGPALYAFWDDLTLDAAARVRTGVSGTAPGRRFTVSWENALLTGTSVRVSFDAVLHENGRIDLEYQDLPDDRRAYGSSATVGIQSADGHAKEYWHHLADDPNRQSPLRDGGSVTFLPPASVTGQITDAATGAPVAGATVRLVRMDRTEGQVTTDSTGRYAMRVPLGSYTLTASHGRYFPGEVTPVAAGTPTGVVTRNVTLTPRE